MRKCNGITCDREVLPIKIAISLKELLPRARKEFVADSNEVCGTRWCTEGSIIDRINSAYEAKELGTERQRIDALLDALHDAAASDYWYSKEKLEDHGKHETEGECCPIDESFD